MAATPKPVRKHAKATFKMFEKKYPGYGDRRGAKKIAKAHAEKGLVTKKGRLNTQKVKESRKKEKK